MKWSSLATGLTIVLQLVFASLMARLLNAEAFGLAAVGIIVIRCGSYFAQLGVAQRFVQEDNLTEQTIRAGMSVSLIVGVAFCLLFQLIALPAADFFGDRRIEPITRVLALSFVTSGLGSASLALLRRQLAFGRLAAIELSSYGLGYGITGVLLALAGFGVWSLVYASLCQSLFSLSASLFANRRWPILSWEWTTMFNLFPVGVTISLISFLEFAGSSLDTFLIGLFERVESLGVYNRVFMLAYLPLYALTTTASRVLFPYFSRLQNDRESLTKGILISLTAIPLIIVPVSLSLAVCAEEAVLVVLGDQWVAGIEILPPLTLAVLFRMLSHLGGVTCDATRRLREKVILHVSSLLATAGILIALKPYGILGFAWGLCVGELLLAVGYVVAVRLIISISYLDMIRPLIVSIRVGAVCAAAVSGVSFLLKSFPLGAFETLVMAIAVGSLVLSLQVIVFPSRTISSSLALVTGMEFGTATIGKRFKSLLAFAL